MLVEKFDHHPSSPIYRPQVSEYNQELEMDTHSPLLHLVSKYKGVFLDNFKLLTTTTNSLMVKAVGGISAQKMTDFKGSTSIGTDIHVLHKEWDEALCPICMDHPHNAVLLLCSSYDKGCRPYICDSSYRHSNCLDRFKKSLRTSPPQPGSSFPENTESSRLGERPQQSYSSESAFRGIRTRNHLAEGDRNHMLDESSNGNSAEMQEVLGENDRQEPHRYLVMQNSGVGDTSGLEPHRDRIDGDPLAESSSVLKCPLCRGFVKGWEIVEEARQYLDLKQRSCSLESCSFSGNYLELRRHARRVHPTTRPAVIDTSRQRAWRNLESQQEYGDIVSAIRSAMPSAIVFGDYVIESGDGFSGDRDNGSDESSGPLLTSFILYQMIRPFSPAPESRGMSRAWRRYRRTSERRTLWGENLLGLQDDDSDWNMASDMGEDAPPIPRRRRRFTRSRPDEEP